MARRADCPGYWLRARDREIQHRGHAGCMCGQYPGIRSLNICDK